MKVFAPYIPVTDGNLAVWAGTYKEKLGQLGPGLGLPEEEIAQQQGFAQDIIDSIAKTDLKKVELKEAVAAKSQFRLAHLQQIRGMAARIKKLSTYTESIGKEMGIVNGNTLIDANNLKPSLQATSYPGFVSLSFTKQRMGGVSIYIRLKGQVEWQHLDWVKKSPYADESPLSVPNQPEAREYMASCYDGFNEFGHFSDIVTVVHGG